MTTRTELTHKYYVTKIEEAKTWKRIISANWPPYTCNQCGNVVVRAEIKGPEETSVCPNCADTTIARWDLTDEDWGYRIDQQGSIDATMKKEPPDST